jgi:PRTRC genetic system protein A
MAMDTVIQRMFPLVAMPTKGSLAPSSGAGTRFVVARDGLWREVTLPWIYVLHKISESQYQLPYGVQESDIVKVKCGPIPARIRAKFLEDAQAAMPNEAAAAVIWNSADGSWRYELREAYRATPGRITYCEVQLQQDEFLVLDLHSHGEFEAFFSCTDDEDDRGSMKFSGVLGNIDRQDRTAKFRLNMLGAQWDASVAFNGELEVTC